MVCLDSLRGYEGQAAHLYFSSFATKLTGSAFSFNKRERPATDPVNACLSFAYALLQSEFAMAIEHHGLDRFAGFFHASNGDQPALVLDLMEPFRVLVDRLMIKLCSAELGIDDFVMVDGQCRMQDGSRGKLLKAWELLMQQTKQWQGESSSYRQLIVKQAGEFAAYLDGHQPQPHWWRLASS